MPRKYPFNDWGTPIDEEKLAALRRTRAYEVLDRIHACAKETGADKLTGEEIAAEIAKARHERRAVR